MAGSTIAAMAKPIRVMLEHGKKKRVVASAFDWPGWDRSAKTGDDVLEVLDAYRVRFAKVADLAGYGDQFARLGDFEVVEEVAGIGMTDYYGVSGVTATAETKPMSNDEFERKLALLQASWVTFDETAARVSNDLRLGPRGGGREKSKIVAHANGAEIDEFARKVGVRVPMETRDDRQALLAYRSDFADAIREYHLRGDPAGRWALPFLIRRCAWHMLDHAWELEDRNLTDAPPEP